VLAELGHSQIQNRPPLVSAAFAGLFLLARQPDCDMP